MKFTVTKQTLYNSLQRMMPVVPTKTTIPVLTNILFELNKNSLRLTGTDLEVSIITTLDVLGEENGKAALPAKKMFDLIRELPDTPLAVTCDSSNRLTIKTEKGLYKISGESSEEYPHIATDVHERKFSYSATGFIKLVEKTMFAVSTDELRTTLMGVLLDLRPNEMRMVATDGHRLAKVVDSNFSYSSEPGQVIMPVKALQLLGRNIDQVDQMDIAISRDHITFMLGATTIYSKVINGHYPSYERVIPSDNNLTMQVERDLVSATVRRSSIFANQHTHQVRWQLAPNTLTLVAEDLESGGNSNESIAVDYAGDEFEIGYNANYVLEILRHVDTEQALFRLRDAGSAAIIEPLPQPEGLHYMMLLMPIRLNE
ncbi:MAG: DNA polymerase III subunit beta [candidate division KSB1 bacterium]